MDSKQVKPAGKRTPPAAGKGRVAGTPNKTTKALKEAILLAAEQTGEDGKGKDGTVGYLKLLARAEPKSFAGLLGKVLPLQVTGEDGSDLKATITVQYVAPGTVSR